MNHAKPKGPPRNKPGHSAPAASPPVALLVAQILQYVRLLVPYWRRAPAPSVHLVISRRDLSSSAKGGHVADEAAQSSPDEQLHRVCSALFAIRQLTVANQFAHQLSLRWGQLLQPRSLEVPTATKLAQKAFGTGR